MSQASIFSLSVGSSYNKLFFVPLRDRVVDLCTCMYSQEVIQDDEAYECQRCKSTSTYLVLMMKTLKVKQLLKISQVVKYAQDS